MQFLICSLARTIISALTPYYAVNYLLFMMYCLLFAALAATCVKYMSADIVGSGVPEMKAIMGGHVMPEFLSVRTWIAKMMGIAATISASFSVGKDDIFIHLAGCLTTTWLKLPWFKRIRQVNIVCYATNT